MMIRAGVAAGHPSTAQAGAEILSQGGSAVDAAVSMMLVSCAAETIFTGLGGGGFATVFDAATSQVRCLDFFVSVPGLGGKRPSHAKSIEVIFIGQHVPYEIGPATVAVPGIPGRGALFVAAMGPAVLGSRYGSRARSLVRDTVPRHARTGAASRCRGDVRWRGSRGLSASRWFPAARRRPAAPS